MYNHAIIIVNISIIIIIISIFKYLIFKNKNIKILFLHIFTLSIFIILYVVLSYHRLKEDINIIYQTGQTQYDYGVFLSHLSNGIGGRGGIIEKFNQLYKLPQREIKGHCFFQNIKPVK